MRRLLFLPGVGGSAGFWRPLGDRLPAEWNKTYLGWPGLGDNPPDPHVRSYDDLVRLTEAQLGDEPVDLLAQSMGGVIALSIALKHPDKVRRLVLAVTSGGMDVSRFGANDWREDYERDFPHVADWVMSERPDVSDKLYEIKQPVLLIWGDADPISPVAVGEHLAQKLPDASLRIVPGGQHDLILTRADQIASTIRTFLS